MRATVDLRAICVTGGRSSSTILRTTKQFGVRPMDARKDHVPTIILLKKRGSSTLRSFPAPSAMSLRIESWKESSRPTATSKASN